MNVDRVDERFCPNNQPDRRQPMSENSIYGQSLAEYRALTAAGVDVETANTVADIRRDSALYAGELRQAAQRIIETMERVIRTIDEGGTVNSLGELQGSGPSFDVMCALYVERAQNARRVSYPHRDVLAGVVDVDPITEVKQ